ncbi:MAG: hypothetical protein ACK4GO_07445 [Gemmobacter sp.]
MADVVVTPALIIAFLSLLVGLGNFANSLKSAKKASKGDREEMLVLLDKATKFVKAPWKLQKTEETKVSWRAIWTNSKIKARVVVMYYFKDDSVYFTTSGQEDGSDIKTRKLTPAELNKLLKVYELVKKDPTKSGKLLA